MENLIYIAKISDFKDSVGNDTTIHHWNRERYSKELQQRKKYSNFYYERVTEKKAKEIQKQNNRNFLQTKYDNAIMGKYNIGIDYKENRWFMEQVRPTI